MVCRTFTVCLILVVSSFPSVGLYAEDEQMQLETHTLNINGSKISVKLPKALQFSRENLRWRAEKVVPFEVSIRFFDASKPEDEKEDEFRATSRAVQAALKQEVRDSKLGLDTKTRTNAFDGKSHDTKLWKYFYYIIDEDNVGDILYRACILKKAANGKMALLSFETTISVTKDTPTARAEAAKKFDDKIAEMLDSYSIE